jgi:nitrite reductase/ring-hydroxylating ferredoxin subunit
VSSGGARDGELFVPLSKIPDHGLLAATLPDGTRVVVIRRGETVTALEDECSHQAMPLSAGTICEDGTIECPWHGARFDATSGRCVQGPATDDVRAFDVVPTGNGVRIRRRS